MSESWNNERIELNLAALSLYLPTLNLNSRELASSSLVSFHLLLEAIVKLESCLLEPRVSSGVEGLL